MTYEAWSESLAVPCPNPGLIEMYADWTSDRKEQYRAGVEAMRDAIAEELRRKGEAGWAERAECKAARLLEEKP